MSKNSCQKKDWIVLEIVFRSDRDLNEIEKALIKKVKEAQTVLNKRENISKVKLNLNHQEVIIDLKSQIDRYKRAAIELYKILNNYKETHEIVEQALCKLHDDLEAIIAKETMRINAHKLNNADKNNDVSIH